MEINLRLRRITPAIAALLQALQEADDAAYTAACTPPGILGRCEIQPEPELPPGCTQTKLEDAIPPAEEKPKRTRRTKEQIAALGAEQGMPVTPPPAPEVKPVDPEAKTEVIAKPAEPPKVDPQVAMQKGEDLFGDEKLAAAPPAKTWTKEELRALLTQCAEDPKRGPEKARALMREHGKADRLSDIQPMFYSAVAAALGA